MTTKERQENVKALMDYAKDKEIAADAYGVALAILGYDEEEVEAMMERAEGIRETRKSLREILPELADNDLETLVIRAANKA